MITHTIESYWIASQIESITTTTMEGVSTGVLEKKEHLRSKDGWVS